MEYIKIVVVMIKMMMLILLKSLLIFKFKNFSVSEVDEEMIEIRKTLARKLELDPQ